MPQLVGVLALHVLQKFMAHIGEDILGNWFISDLDESDCEDGLIIFRPDGICIQFMTSKTLPVISSTFRLYYTWEDEKTLIYRLSPNGTPWTRRVERTPSGWTMICEAKQAHDKRARYFPCRRAHTMELPTWFDEMVEINIGMLARRAKKEAEQAAT